MTQAISQEELIEISRKRSKNFGYFAQNHLKIRSRDFRLLPLRFNKTQQYIDDLIEEDIANNRPVRMIILKARQEGVSTYSEGRLFHLIDQTPFATSMVVAHDDDSTQHLFDMTKTYYDFLPRWIKPTTRYSNRREIYLNESSGQPLRSQMVIENALSKGIGRSWTLHGLHISELAFWPSNTARVLLRGLLQAVPDVAGTMVFIESTANGISGEFYERFWNAWNGKSEYRAVFIPWFWEPSYSRALNVNPEEFTATLSNYERTMLEKHGLTLEQLHWRRYKISTTFDGDVLGFNQEFPAEPEDAFISASNTVFHKEALMEMLPETSEPERFNFNASDELVVASTEQDAYVRIWKKPEADHLYIIAADVAEGLAKGDYSCADVIDMQTLEQVAQWHGHIDPDLFGDELCKLGNYYNKALLIPESNNHGLTTISSITRHSYAYLYRRQELDRITKKLMEKLGWQTNAKTKPLAIDSLNEHIREKTVIINCRETIQECLTYVRDARGSMGADGDAHDDRVMSLAIALKVWQEVPKVKRKEPEEDKTDHLSREERIARGMLKTKEQRHEFLGEV